MAETTTTRAVYVVEKFIPARCPKCVRRFRSSKDFGMFAVTQKAAKHFGDALAQQVRLFPELGMRIVTADAVIKELARPPREPERAEGRLAKDFIICNHCENVTLRIRLGEEQVFAKDEAERLIKSKEFTCWTKGEYHQSATGV